MTSVRRAGLAAALAAAPFALAWRFALVYRVRAGSPHPRTPSATPLALGMAFEEVTVPSRGADLAGWFIPAQGGSPGPGVALVHGWESGRDRTLPLAHVLHEVGFHVLSIDVRGHGANAAERLPVTGGEFGADAGAAFDQLLARPEVTVGAIHGHSMGGIGAILAAAADSRVSALAATSAPADPYRLTRQTFRLARLPIPDPIAYPLAWWTTRVFLQPRGHTVADVSASEAIGRYRGPVLLLHGDADDVVPVAHVARLAAAARRARAGRSDPAPVTSVVIEGGRHSWLYEDPSYRASLARFLATGLGGPLEPDEAARVAAGVRATRMPDPETRFAAVQAEPGGLRSLPGVAIPGTMATPTPGEGLPDEEPPGPPPGFDPLHLPASPNEPSGA